MLTRLYSSLEVADDAEGQLRKQKQQRMKSNDRWYEELIAASDEEARIFTEAQHAGSLGPARYLAKLLDLKVCIHWPLRTPVT